LEELTLLATKTSTLIAPYGGQLVDLMVPAESSEELKAYAGQLPSIQISPRSVCDLELLATGAFSPLNRFMGQEDHQRVLNEMRLADGHIFPIPVALAVDASPALSLDQDIALRNNENELLAVMTIEEIYAWDRTEVSEKVFGTQDSGHPWVTEMHRWGTLNISGRLQMLQLSRHYDFQDLRLTPAQTRAKLAEIGRKNVVAFQTPNPLHRLYEELTKQLIKDVEGTLLLHPVVGMTKLGDVDHYTRVCIYRAFAERYYQPDQVFLSLLPLVTRMAGPREALWQALIRRNYGANHLIVSPNHASPGTSSAGTPFYNPYDAQELVEKHSRELGVKVVPSQVLVYLPEQDRYDEGMSRVSAGRSSVSISSSRVREQHPDNGQSLPSWYTRSEAAEILAEICPPRHHQGVCIWFTGLSGSGKSTTAQILTWLVLEHGRRVTVLDGDVVRTHLSKGLGFTKEDRDTNVRRIGFVASELVRLGGVVICSVVSPYRATRNDVRNMVGKDHFVEVFVDTPLEVCEVRDVKGMYAKARRGEIKAFTGIDDPYEPPHYPEIRLDTVNYTSEENANFIVNYLIKQGYVHLSKKNLCNPEET
jgi:sulfate adenylyltransferase